MELFVVETFQYNYQDTKVVSQYILVESEELARKIVDEAVKEYEGEKEVGLLINNDSSYVYGIITPGVKGLTNNSEFFIGCFRRHVNTQSDLDVLMSQWEKVKKS